MNCDNTSSKKLSPYLWMMEETSCRNIEDYLYDSYDVDMDMYGGYHDVTDDIEYDTLMTLMMQL